MRGSAHRSGRRAESSAAGSVVVVRSSLSRGAFPGRGGRLDLAPRSEFARVQRARILAAMVRVVAEEGAGAVTVSRVVQRAGVSRRTFYELFASCEDCFLAVFENTIERARGVVSDAVANASSVVWREQIRVGLGALLEFFDEEPTLGVLLVVDALGAGPRALERRARVLDELAGIVDRGRDGKAGGNRHRRPLSTASTASSVSSSPLTGEGVVGAVFSVVHARMVQHDRRPLIELLSPLMGMIVLPYQGRAIAAKELASPAPKRSRRRPRRGSTIPQHPRNGHARWSPLDPLDGLDMRLTSRTLLVLCAIASEPGASNRQIADSAGVHDQGQISKLLGRLAKLGLIHNSGNGQPRGEPNAWTLTTRGAEIHQALTTSR
jgi:AcrR family transcriptional regulator/DNA-binding MarR family transcriptional regulator